MHEHIGDHLPDPEIGTIKVMNSQQACHHWTTEHQCGDVKYYVYDQEVFYYRGNMCKWGWSVIHAILMVILFFKSLK